MPLDMPLSINPFARHRKKKAVFPIVLFHLIDSLNKLKIISSMSNGQFFESAFIIKDKYKYQ